MRRRIRSAALPLHRHSLPQLGIDAALVALAYLLAFRLRFDGGIPTDYADLLAATLPYVVAASLLIFTLFGLYEKWWRYVGQRDYVGILQAVVVATLFVPAFNALTHPEVIRSGRGEVTLSVPPGVLAFFFLLTLVLVGGSRFVARTVYERPLSGFRPRPGARRVLIIGAGDGGRLVLREIVRNPDLGMSPVGFVDDDPTKHRMRIDGVRVLGRTDELARILVGLGLVEDPGQRSRRRPARCARASSRPAAPAGSRSARCRRSSSCCRPAPATSCARRAPSRSRTSSAASPCGWRSTASGATCRTRS
jgi:hypothetical protein